MVPQVLVILPELGAAWICGMAVGLERSVNGRAAGFRTHALVSLASATVMLAARAPSFLPNLFPASAPAMLDPTHLLQGVMTGVGFLGAGVIFKQGASIQGLTTAASIWATAAFGAMFGLGLWSAGAAAAVGVLTTLTLLRFIEARLAVNTYAVAAFRYRADEAPTEAELLQRLSAHSVRFDELSYALLEDGTVLEYSGVVRTRRDESLGTMARSLVSTPGLVGYSLTRISK
jgi:putative Mg2+ transporter-C (MgtC) family protein